MADITAGLGGLLSGLTGAFSGLLSGVKQQVKATQDTANSSQQLTKGFNRLLSVVEELSAHIRGVALPVPSVQPANPSKGAIGGLPAGAGGAGGKGGAGGAGGAGGLAGAAGGIGLELGSALAGIGAVVGTLQQLASAAQQFVQALNPNLMEYFNQTILDLQATFGHAFEPVFALATGVFQKIAGIVLPLMQQLRPVFESLANNAIKQLIMQVRIVVTVLRVLVPIINLFLKLQQVINMIGMLLTMLALAGLAPVLAALKILEPVLNFFSSILDGVMDVVSAFGEVFEAVGVIFDVITDMIKEAVMSLFGGTDIQSVFKDFVKMIRQAIAQLVVFVARLALLFGFTKFVDRLKESLTPKQGLKAAGQTSITSIESISKSLIESAAKATGAGAQTEEDWRKETLDALNNMERGSIFQSFRPALEKVVEVLNSIKHGIYKIPGTGPEPPNIELPRV